MRPLALRELGLTLTLGVVASLAATKPGDDDHPLFPLDHGIIKPEEQAAHDMEKYDHDKDGKVSLEEMTEQMRKALATPFPGPRNNVYVL